MGSDFRNQLSWSHSRHELFRECPRRYFYHYYGAWGGWRSDAEPATRRLYILKQLKARHLWAGGLVHDAVADLLRPLRHGRRDSAATAEPLRERTLTAVIDRMRSEFRRSRSGDYLQDPKRAPGLLEHHYAEPVDDEQWRDLAATVRRSIEGFFDGPWLREIEALAPEAFLALEDLDTFEIAGVPVYVKLDLAHRVEPQGARIVDWKTGRRLPQPGGEQLGIYALYAIERWQLPAEAIEIREVNLSSGEEAAAGVSAELLDRTRATIERSIEAMQARLADPRANLARVEDFPAQVGERVCRSCAFREVCPEYAQARA
jgi:hypothetical protein